MCISKRSIIYLIIYIFICSLFIGCSKSPVPSSPAKEKSMNNSENDRTIKNSSSLESWIGDYAFSEFAPPDKNRFYIISIYKENSDYYAKISIDGFQILRRIQAKVSGDGNSIKLLFYKYLPDNVFEPFNEGNMLLSFEKRNSQLYTFWGEIQPILESNTKSGEVYFKVETQ